MKPHFIVMSSDIATKDTTTKKTSSIGQKSTRKKIVSQRLKGLNFDLSSPEALGLTNGVNTATTSELPILEDENNKDVITKESNSPKLQDQVSNSDNENINNNIENDNNNNINNDNNKNEVEKYVSDIKIEDKPLDVNIQEGFIDDNKSAVVEYNTVVLHEHDILLGNSSVIHDESKEQEQRVYIEPHAWNHEKNVEEEVIHDQLEEHGGGDIMNVLLDNMQRLANRQADSDTEVERIKAATSSDSKILVELLASVLTKVTNIDDEIKTNKLASANKIRGRIGLYQQDSENHISVAFDNEGRVEEIYSEEDKLNGNDGDFKNLKIRFNTILENNKQLEEKNKNLELEITKQQKIIDMCAKMNEDQKELFKSQEITNFQKLENQRIQYEKEKLELNKIINELEKVCNESHSTIKKLSNYTRALENSRTQTEEYNKKLNAISRVMDKKTNEKIMSVNQEASSSSATSHLSSSSTMNNRSMSASSTLSKESSYGAVSKTMNRYVQQHKHDGNGTSSLLLDCFISGKGGASESDNKDHIN